MEPLQRTRPRAGFGLLLLLVLSVMAVSGILLISRGLRLQNTLRGTGHDLHREKSRLILESAILEARSRLGEECSRTGSEAFRAFRTGSSSGLAVPTPTVEAFRDDAARPLETSVSFLLQGPLDSIAYERGGILRFRSALAGSVLGSENLAMVADFEYKIVNLAPPRPFGRFGLSVWDGHAVLGPAPNGIVARSIRALRNLAEMAGGWVSRIDEEGLRPQVADLAAGLERLRDTLSPIAGVGGSDPTPALVFGRPDDTGFALSVLAPRPASGTDQDLARFHLPTRLRPFEERLVLVEERFDAASNAFSRRLESPGFLSWLRPGGLEPEGSNLLQAAGDLAAAHRAILDELATYRSALSLVSGPDRARWLEQYWSRLTPEAWERRLTYRIEAGTPLEDIPVPDGVFGLDGSRELVDRTLGGRKILVVTGPTRIRNLRRRDDRPGCHLLTIVAFADLAISGAVEASILVAPGRDRRPVRIAIDPGTRITGVLALGPGASATFENGSIEGDRWTDAGGFEAPLKEDRHVVLIAPEPLSQHLEEL